MKDLKTFTIIVPTYNNEKDISVCLRSLINQKKEDGLREIIVVNDGSTDNTGEIIKAFSKKDKRIKIITTTNYGVSHARNLGVSMVHGDYVTFVDGDDSIAPDCIKKIQSIIQKNIKIDFLRYNFVESGNKRFNNKMYGLDGEVLDIDSKKEKINRHLLSIQDSIPNLCQLLVVKKPIAKKISFNEELVYLEDQLYYQDLLNVSKYCLFYNYCGYYLKTSDHSSSMSSDRVEKNIASLLRANEIMHSKEDCKIIDKTHFILLISKLSLLKKDQRGLFMRTLRIENVKKLAERAKSEKMDISLKLIALAIIKNKFKLAIHLVNTRKKLSDLKRSIR